MPLPILALALSAFAIGTTEFVIMGLLPVVANDLSITLPAAGLLVTGYALGVAVGAPLMAILTGKLERKTALLLLMLVFTIGNVSCALAPSYTPLMVARVVTSFAHGAFFGTGAVVAATLVAPERRSSAIALMFTGLTLANVLGVPFGTFVGQELGWRATFWIIAALGLASMAGIQLLLPRQMIAVPTKLSSELKVLFNAQVLLALAMTIFGFGGVFVIFTFIAPILEQVTGVSPRGVTLILAAMGVGLTIGNTIGGKMADRALMPSLLGILALLALIMLFMPTTLHQKWPAVGTLFVWSIAAFATVTPLQSRVVQKASTAPNLASTLNISAFNLGNAAGAWIGGAVLTYGLGLPRIPIAAACVTSIAILITFTSYWMERRSAL